MANTGKNWDYLWQGLALGAAIGLIVGIGTGWNILNGPPNPLVNPGPHGSQEELGFAVSTGVSLFVRYTSIFGVLGFLATLFSGSRKSNDTKAR